MHCTGAGDRVSGNAEKEEEFIIKPRPSILLESMNTKMLATCRFSPSPPRLKLTRRTLYTGTVLNIPKDQLSCSNQFYSIMPFACNQGSRILRNFLHWENAITFLHSLFLMVSHKFIIFRQRIIGRDNIILSHFLHSLMLFFGNLIVRIFLFFIF